MINEKLLKIGAIVFVIFLLFIFLFSYVKSVRSPLKLMSTSVEDSSEVEIITPISFLFNKKIDRKTEATFKIEPKNKGGLLKINNNILSFTPNSSVPFFPNTKYIITFTPVNVYGKKSDKVEFTFYTEDISDMEKLPKELQDEMNKTGDDYLEDGKVKGHEIVGLLPYEASDFTIYFLDPEGNDNIEYVIILKGQNKEASKVNALKWMRDNGADPDKLTISYE